MKPVRFKPSFRDTLAANRAAVDGLAKMAGVPPLPLSQVESAMRPKREIVNRSDADELEAAVLRECGELLAMHPLITMCVRQNTGAATTAQGAPVWFYRWITRPQEMTLTDFWGFSVRGPFAVEAKRRNWKWTGTQREIEQRAFITHVRLSGGWGGFVTGTDDLLKLLDGGAFDR